MSLDVLDIVKNGLKETFSSTGLKLIGAFYLINVVNQVANNSLMAQSVVPTGGAQTATPLALTAIPAAVWMGVLAAIFLANLALTLGALRNFVKGNFEELNRDYFKEDLAMPTLNLAVGSIVFALVVALGTVAFVIPGIYLFISLLFWQIYVAVEDDNFIDAMKNSWGLTKGNKIDLFLVGIGVVGVSIVAAFLVGLPVIAVQTVSQAAATLLSAVLGSFGTVLTLSVIAHAYNELQ